MTYEELLKDLVSRTGPCLRLCSYCPEYNDTAEVKECVEDLVREVYQLRLDNNALMVKLLDLSTAYKLETGKDFPL